MNKNLMLDKAEELGWIVREYKDCVVFHNYSPEGEDISIDIDYNTGNDLEKAQIIVAELEALLECFNPEEHAVMWYGQNRGEPSSLKVLIHDAEDIKLMYEDLYKAVSNVA